MGTVSKSDLIKDTAARAGTTMSVAKDVIEHMLEGITKHAEAGDTVSLMGFGRFAVKARAARIGRNPGTGLPVEIAESRTLTFKASKKKEA